jgi:hypothetical protein
VCYREPSRTFPDLVLVDRLYLTALVIVTLGDIYCHLYFHFGRLWWLVTKESMLSFLVFLALIHVSNKLSSMAMALLLLFLY